MKDITIIDKELDGLEQSKADQIKAVFSPMIEGVKALEGAYNEIIKKEVSPETCKEARALRLSIKDARKAADKVRVEQKAEYLRAAGAIQGVFNIFKYAIGDKEENLKSIETHYERIEQAKKEALHNERLEKAINLGYIDQGQRFEDMDEAIYEAFINGLMKSFEEKEKKIREMLIEAEEEEDKKELYRDRKETLLPYSYLGEIKLTLDTTLEEFNAMRRDFKALEVADKKKKEQEKAERERLFKERAIEEAKREKERKLAQVEKDRLEAIAQKAEDEAKKLREEADALRAEKEKEEKRIAQEEEDKKTQSDKERIQYAISQLEDVLAFVKTGSAKSILKKAIHCLLDF